MGMTQTGTIATAQINGSTITIVERTHRLTGQAIFVVEEAAMGYLSTWDIKDSELEARESASRLWTRRAGKETMIGCGPSAI
jgi:hypothetical protein